MALSDVLSELRGDPQFMANVMAWRTLPPRPLQAEPFPAALHPILAAALRRRGIHELYSHQARALRLAFDGHHLVLATPTASGKTLCYNLPVLQSLLYDEGARSLYLFPTKALAHDQLAELGAWRPALEEQPYTGPSAPFRLHVAAYDGDTPSAERSAIRQQAQLILTNPDMLHAGILPYHTAWASFFAGLRYVIIDELHTYRGVFGSQVANVLRRLQRICTFYGSRPQFICTSATIANPQQLAERLLEQPVAVIDENGAPSGEKHIILYNPPVYDAEHGLRRSSVLEARDLAARCVVGGVQTILFGRSRLTTEVLLTYLRDRLVANGAPRGLPRLAAGDPRGSPATSHQPPATSHSLFAVRGYRGGYLPNERRAIEAGLRSGEVQAVVATNALELGIDIGHLQAAILCGYPGSIASAWQQMGRAGRAPPPLNPPRSGGEARGGGVDAALAILIATSGALDQYMIRHPDYFFGRSPEHALINPDNLMLLVDQVRCAAFELPFQAGGGILGAFGASPYIADVLDLLSEQGDLSQHGGRYFWSGEGYPARQVGLRSSGGDNVVIQAVAAPNIDPVPLSVDIQDAIAIQNPKSKIQNQVIGQIDRLSAPAWVHDGAIYLHEGRSYRVVQLDLEQNLALVTPTEVDYYTEATVETTIDVLAEHAHCELAGAQHAHGELRVTTQVVGFRRVKRLTHENLGVEKLDYPAQEMETNGYWFSILPQAQAVLEGAGQWYDSGNNYGPGWQEQRARVRVRDGYRCTQCGAPETNGRQHDVHHVIPFRTFGYVPGLNDYDQVANQLDNLVLVCRTCHQRLESTVRVRSGMDGVAYALNNLAPLYLMCDPQDIGVSVARGGRQPRASDTLPTLYIYERAAAGLGFSARLYELHQELTGAARALIAHCQCSNGCPACVGPILEGNLAQLPTKGLALAILDVLATPGSGLVNDDLRHEFTFM
jgi:DEAD/DEAH box helicase domain-containing protein